MGGLWRLRCKGEVQDHTNGDRRKNCIADRSPYGRARVKAPWLIGTGSEMIGLGIIGWHSVLLVTGHKENASQETVSSGKKNTGQDKPLIRKIIHCICRLVFANILDEGGEELLTKYKI